MLEERLRDPEFRIEYERSTVTCSSSSRRRRRDQSWSPAAGVAAGWSSATTPASFA